MKAIIPLEWNEGPFCKTFFSLEKKKVSGILIKDNLQMYDSESNACFQTPHLLSLASLCVAYLP